LKNIKLKKKQVPKANIAVENVSNINKKEKTALEVESDKDALFIKNQEERNQQQERQQQESKQGGKKQKTVIPSSELKFRGKRHRGINVPLEELPPRQPRTPKNDRKENDTIENTQRNQQTTNGDEWGNQSNQSFQSNQSNDWGNQSNQSNQSNDWGNQGDSQTNQNRGGGNFRGKRGNKGGYNTNRKIFKEDFPSLSGEVVIEEKPFWVNNN